FEDWELKFLMDSVSNCSFLTAEQTENLARKLKDFAPASSLSLLCCDGIPMQNKPDKSYVKYNLDCILHAIKNKAAITFNYGQANIKGEFIARKKGKKYVVNPYTVVLSEQRYYLVCNTKKHDGIGYYRLDRIRNPEPLTDSCLPLHSLPGFEDDNSLAEYIGKTFYMHAGNEITVTLQCHTLCLDDVSEKFGKNCTFEYLNDECFRITGNVVESDGFYYWLLQFGKNVEVVSPPSVRCHLLDIIKDIEIAYSPQPL
ncbi:MAG: WYL domain-containing protein, partial [Oscillospiraceae bacterium]